MKKVIKVKDKLFYKGYLDIEELNKAIDKTGSDGLVLCERVNGQIDTAVDITRKTVALAEINEEDIIEEFTQRGCLVYYGDILEELNESEDKTVSYGLKDLKDNTTVYTYTFELLDKNDKKNAEYFNQNEND